MASPYKTLDIWVITSPNNVRMKNSPRPKSWGGCFISAIYHVADSDISFTLLHGLVSRLYRRQIVVLDLICETVSV